MSIPTLDGKIPVQLFLEILSQKIPEGTQLGFAFTERTLIHQARNQLAKRCLDLGMDYLWFLDDDVIPPKDALAKMLVLDKDIVVPPVKIREQEEGKKERLALLEEGWGEVTELKETRKIGFGGMSCTLIRRRVLEEMFKNFERPFEFGNAEDYYCGEDYLFCYRAKSLGFEIWGIHDVKPLHMKNKKVFLRA